MTSKECEKFLEIILDFGKKYVLTGAEIKRVEDSLIKICEAYGFEDIEIYAITSLILVTVKNKDGEHFTQSVRVTKGGTDLGRIEELSKKYKYICANTPDVDELEKMILGMKKSKPKPFIKCIGYMLAAGGFAVFFGGTLLDGLASMLVGIAIYFMDYHFKIRDINQIVYTFIASLISGILCIILVHFGVGANIDKVMIGDIMIFIPGLLLVNSIKEMFNRDIMSGINKFIEAVLVAVAIAGGFALSMVLLGGVLL